MHSTITSTKLRLMHRLIILIALVAATNFFFLRDLQAPVSSIRNSFCQGTRYTDRQTSPSHHAQHHLEAQTASKAENDTQEELGWHLYHDNGLLEVNPNGPHPIYELIKRGHEAWRDKLKRSSSTFEEAVDEYQRRYKRLPPPGFVEWWTYVEKHDVQLPDEYDQIFKDLEPFWGIDPQDLQRIQNDWGAHVGSYTIGRIPHHGPVGGGPDFNTAFRAVFSPHDNPDLPLHFKLRKEALKAARSGTFINVNNPPKVTPGGWISSCPPVSPARKQAIDWGKAPRGFMNSSNPKSFIYNHRSAMDPCQHPSHFLLHDITTAMPMDWIEDLPQEDNPSWHERWDGRLQWRGSNKGIWHANDRRWDLAQRARLVRWTGDGDVEGLDPLGENVTVLMPVKEGKKVGRGASIKREQWAGTMLDIAFAGEPSSCAPEMCEKLREIFEYRKYQDQTTAGRYKYYIDVDGHAWSSRFKSLITSNALVFKSTVYPEWYTDRIEPWVHYVPVQLDLSDLWDALVFFRGDPAGNGAHEDIAKEIAEAGRAWSKSFWRKEDMVAYMFRLFLEYARVMDPMREKLTYLRTSARSNRAGNRPTYEGEPVDRQLQLAVPHRLCPKK
ncbi:glycosyl transferase family 90-domain-containing protein [Gymnopilus junonius]|uniref:Glycosyl transferase family 90-domain-containing protein n=1 Tax=Gymnopilus junonius TaxID=109634 RepID=A0A9P5TSR1_GYMJU|nr:glycosyl transferase family 90-domain-containing protein [Gymnopilus junonius]